MSAHGTSSVAGYNLISRDWTFGTSNVEDRRCSELPNHLKQWNPTGSEVDTAQKLARFWMCHFILLELWRLHSALCWTDDWKIFCKFCSVPRLQTLVWKGSLYWWSRQIMPVKISQLRIIWWKRVHMAPLEFGRYDCASNTTAEADVNIYQVIQIDATTAFFITSLVGVTVNRRHRRHLRRHD